MRSLWTADESDAAPVGPPDVRPAGHRRSCKGHAVLLPINTDAPIYHFPWVTLSLIGANIVTFIAQVSAVMDAGLGKSIWVDEWILSFGDGLHPLQWISWAFLHADPIHLGANMFFLWGFGLVVEGKLGWWRYLALYLGIAAVAGFFDQLLMLGYDGELPAGALGASGVIFGLMAMSFVWAPKNDMTIFMLFFYRAFIFDASILAFCGFYLAIQFLFFALDGFGMGSALLHLTGATIGLAIGVVMLKKSWVDCEGWDLFAVMSNTHGRQIGRDEFYHRDAAFQAGKIATPSEPKHEQPTEKVGSKTLDPRQRIRKFLDGGDAISALGEYEKLVAFHPTWRLGCETLGDLAEAAYRDKSFDDARPLMQQYLERFPDEVPAAATRIRVKYARMLIDFTKRPAEGVAVLNEVDPSMLSPKVANACQELRKRADAAIRSRKPKSKS
ncbi:MAG: rhomboid family intramembrane serine protease [Planctomycetaceae bacterium]